MTDHESDHSPEHSPEHEEVRRLLADARHDEPMPATVVARLDRVLADLAKEPDGAAAVTSPVTSLATRRRRVGQLLVAAAAVLVVGVGIGEVLGGGSTGSQDSVTSDAGADQDAPAAAEAEPEPPVEGAGPQPEAQNDTASRARLVELTSADFEDGVRDTADAWSIHALAPQDLDRGTALLAACSARGWGKGSFVPVSYDGSPGVLVFRRPSGDTQVADLFLCGSSEPVRSITLPAP